MKRKLVFLLIVSALTSFHLYPQNDSIYFERLFYTCKAWGFVKYFHSEIANCSLNWDSVLIAKLPEIKNATDENEFNDILYDMITSPGETTIPGEPPPEIPDSLMLNLNVDWFDNPIFTEEVSAVLDTIYSRFRPRPHCLVDEAFENGNPTFRNDDQYHVTIGFPSEERRMLGLFRYWNIINYFFPYKYIMDQDWDETLNEILPMFYYAKTEIEYNLSILALAKRLNDSHAYTSGGKLNAFFGTNYPRFSIRQIENETVITKVHESVTEVKPGDIIQSIDGHNISLLRDSLRTYAFGSNDESIDYILNQYILRGQYGDFEITVENEFGSHNYVLSRNWTYNSYNDFLQNTGPIWYDTVLNNGCHFGYVDMERLLVNNIDEMMADLWNTDAVIFDIRNYPLGTLWTLVNFLFTEPIHIASFTIPDIQYPGTLFWYEEFIGSYNSEVYNGQIIILFNIRTLSQAEYTCMGLEQYPRSIKIGSITRAADGNVSTIYLPGGVSSLFTGLGTFYPDYTQTQRVGIIPDIEVLPTISSIRNGKDEVLETALNCAILDLNENIMTFPDLRTYPNPFTKSITLSYQLTQYTNTSFEIYNIKGQLVKSSKQFQHQIGKHQTHIDLADLLPGIYFCILKTNTGQYLTKIIKL